MTFAQFQDVQPTVSLKLTPQQPFKPPLHLSRDPAGVVQHQEPEPWLLLEPGEVRWMEVRLSHRWRTPLTLTLKLVDPHGGLRESSCFKGWRTKDDLYDDPGDESDESYELELPDAVEANEAQLHYLVFKIPQDFFSALCHRDVESAPLSLNYPLELQVWVMGGLTAAEDAGNSQLVQLVRFNVALRPECRYVNFLPRVYQEQDFLRRFLAILEESFHPSWDIHQTFWAYLDPKLAPKALLPFLAHWVGWKLDLRLDERRNRTLISEAIKLYRWRGTERGLELCLELYTGLPPEAIEIRQQISKGFIFGETRLGEDEAELGAATIRPYYFEVTLRPDANHALDDEDEQLVRDVIDEYKPAFCQYKLFIQPRPARPAASSSLPANEDSRLPGDDDGGGGNQTGEGGG